MARPAGKTKYWRIHADALEGLRFKVREEREDANGQGCLDARMDMLLGQAEAMIMSAEKRARAVAREKEQASCET